MSSLARNLIAQNKRTREPFLDLGNCGLTRIPAEITELVWIESLSFASSWYEWDGKQWNRKESQNKGEGNLLRDLTSLARLGGLRRLVLDATQVSNLVPLAHLAKLESLNLHNTPVSDLAPIAKLTALQSLEISGTEVRNLAPIAKLTNLRYLFASNTQVGDATPLADLVFLRSIGVWGTQISDLTPVANLSELQSIEVSGTQVRSLAPLCELLSLQSLSANNTLVTDLGPLAGLRSLRSLEVSGTHVHSLAPLASLASLQSLAASDTEVSDLGPLANLTALQTVVVSNTPVSDLAPLANLASLQSLDISNTMTGDLAPLANIPSLQSLAVSNTPVSDLAALAYLVTLQSLDVSSTRVNDVSPLANLPVLQSLDISLTQVSSLAPLVELVRKGLPIKRRLRVHRYDGIYLDDCPLTDPPPEIAAQGNEAILNYFAERARGGVDHLYEAKMLVLGEGGAGKTSLIRRLYQPGMPLPAGTDTTRGIEIYKHQFKLKNGRTFRLNVWDFGGQQIYHATHQFFLTHRSLYVLLDDTLKDYKNVSDEGFRYWLELIEVFGGHSPTLIFQNEKGGRSKAIDFPGIARRYDNVKDLYNGNLEHADAANRLREAVEFFAANLSLVGEELPASWVQVRADLERLAAKLPHVPVEEYFKIYGRHLEFDETKALHLSRYLHDLGVFLHFQDDPLLKRTVILQNEWATTAVFRILDDELVKKKLGRFMEEDCARLWKGTGYDQMHLELLALMQNFELCYALPDHSTQRWLAPQLLPAAKPEELANWAHPGDLIVRYRYDFLPKGMVSRLTVRQHRFVRNPGKAWVTGVLFEQDETAVLVEVLPSGDEIELRARGPENKALLSVISSDLDALNDSFKGLREKVDKRIPCNCMVCSEATSPVFFGHRDMVRRKEHGRLQVECPISFDSVDVLQLLDGVKVEPPPAWSKETPKPEDVRVLRIFLASSSELAEDRDAFELYFRQQNDHLRANGVYLEIIRWEHFLDAISETRLQDEYNEKVRNCDVFVSLFFTKAGKYTEEEFDVAFGQFKSSDRPLLYTYFKDADVRISELELEDFVSRQKFIAKLRDLGHYETEYKNTDGLNLHFSRQLPMIREKLGI